MSASNPASMMAQALNIYKSLIGQDPATAALPESASAAADGKSESSYASSGAHSSLGSPVFSLQDKKKN